MEVKVEVKPTFANLAESVKEKEKKEDEKMRDRLFEEEYREPYNARRKELDFRKLQATRVKSNKRVMIPRPSDQEAEEEILARSTMVRRVVTKFKEEYRTPKNMTPGELRGIEKLERRMKSGEIVIMLTDKSNKLAVVNRELYEKMGEEHVKADMKVSWKFIDEAQKIVHGHLVALNKVFQTGSNFGKKAMERTRAAKEAATHTIPILYLLMKDNKHGPVCTQRTPIWWTQWTQRRTKWTPDRIS